MNTLSVVIPCFNEKQNIERFGRELFPYFKNETIVTDFIFVDDGSTDGSREALQAMSDSSVKIIAHDINRGLGAALRSGFQIATGTYVLTLDADLTFHPDEFHRLLEAMDPETACVSGSALRGRMEDVSWLRRLLSGGVNRIYGFLLGPDVTSASSVFRLYRRSVLMDLPLTSESFDINAEIIFRLHQRGFRIKEVPVRLTTRIYGESKIKFTREIRNHLKIFCAIATWKLIHPKS